MSGRDRTTAGNPVGAVLVAGAGIGGMQAALDLAESGYKVYLSDTQPAIGGTMARLDKTFPTNDCAMCIMSPKLVEAGRHLNIEVLTNSEIVDVVGEPGNFTARVLRRARYVDIAKCTGCGDCATVCPVSVRNEFDAGLGERKAVYKLYPQATPNAFGIDKRGTPPCAAACPAGTPAQGYVALMAQGKFGEALDVVRRRLPFPGILGRVCHHPCEQECNRGQLDQPVSICALKRAAADFGWDAPRASVANEASADAPTVERPRREEKVAVVGAGPAGLTAALDLANLGYQVSVFDSMPKPGGMLRYGIPRYRLPEAVIDRETGWVLEQGIEFHPDTRVGRDVTLADLRVRFAAVLLAVGASGGRGLNVEGNDLQGVSLGVDFLRETALAAGDAASAPTAQARGSTTVRGRNVLVIGGGNVAVDCARTAVRGGAARVSLACLESRAEMPAHAWEVAEAEREGIEVRPSWGPQRILGRDGAVAGVEMLVCASVFDENHRFAPKFTPGTENIFSCDTVILAIGQAVELDFAVADGVTTARGLAGIDEITFATAVPGVFACGDAVSGPTSVIEAIAAAHEAAVSIDRYARGADLSAGRESRSAAQARLKAAKLPIPEGTARHPAARQEGAHLECSRPGWDELMLGLTAEQAVLEAKRCLSCGICSECRECEKVCQRQAIDHGDTDRVIELPVGAVILTPGHDYFDPAERGEFGYGRYPNVLTSVEFERMLSASGPFAGHVRRPSDGAEPKNIAFIQCVGSRDLACGRDYCSAVCCMYAAKEAVMAQEHVPGLKTTIFYMDMRAFGKGFDQYVETAEKTYGVRFRRSIVSTVKEMSRTGDLRLRYLTDDGSLAEEDFDMVILSIGLAASAESKALAARLGVATDGHGFAEIGAFAPSVTSRPGVFAAGTFAGPKDIPETVVESSCAAAMASRLLAPARGTLTVTREYPPEIPVEDEEPRVGVFICRCGRNIASVVDVEALGAGVRELPGVAWAEENLYTCSQDTQERIKEKILEHKLNRVVVASCTPRTHEPLFRDTMREVGLNPYLFEMANIRDQCSWVHMRQPREATAKAADLVAMAVAKARLLRPVPRRFFDLEHAALVIGGGLSGMTAALSLAEQGFEVHLVERETELGGNLRHIHTSLEGGSAAVAGPRALLETTVARVLAEPGIHVYLGSRVRATMGYLGNFRSVIAAGGPGAADGEACEVEVAHGVVIVATGAREAVPSRGQYLYGQNARVITQTQLEERLAAGDPSLAAEIAAGGPFVMIQCVGSRVEGRPYCSRVCCSQAVKNALLIKRKNPGAVVYVLYRDIRTYGLKEQHYQEARRAGVIFVRYDPERAPVVAEERGLPVVTVADEALRRPLIIPAARLVLAAGMQPEDHTELAQILKVPLTPEGFFLEAHLKLRPVEFSAEGMYLCGLAHSPKLIGESVAQANAAAVRASCLLSKQRLEAKGITVEVNARLCTGCGVCAEVCAYEARVVDEETRTARVLEVLCQGCGACAVACPSGATQQKGFEKRQILAMLDAAASG
jgi:heterodisulfide reductase subunit A-like polyferredoxin